MTISSVAFSSPIYVVSTRDSLHELRPLSYSNFKLAKILRPKQLHCQRFDKGTRIAYTRACTPLRVTCESKVVMEEEKKRRRYSPYLEGALLSGVGETASSEWKAIPDIWRSSAEKFGDRIALIDPHHNPPTAMTYAQLEQEILNFSEGLRVIGVEPDEKIALFAENSCRWLIADQSVMATGAINVVRGSKSSTDELLQIYLDSESVALIVEDPVLFNRIADVFYEKACIRFVILLWGDKSSLSKGGTNAVPFYDYHDIIHFGQESRKVLLTSKDYGDNYRYEAINIDDVATISYTSGTTGFPKGVMLTHRNLLHQISSLWDVLPAVAGDRFVSVCPIWHIYERSFEYLGFAHGMENVYSTMLNLKEDLRRYQPHYLLGLPLVIKTIYGWTQEQISTSSAVTQAITSTFIKISMAFMENRRIYEGKCLTKDPKQPSHVTALFDCLWAVIISAILCPLHMLANAVIYNKIRNTIGISKGAMTGASNLPEYVEKFFEAIGVSILNGYGMTECSTVVVFRRRDCNVIGSAGRPTRQTEVKIVDPETGKTLPPGMKGVVKIRGPQVMKGYHKVGQKPEATSRVLDEEGWYNADDYGWVAPHHTTGRSRHCGGVFVPVGRLKDTIVLSTGEHVEPIEIEDAVRSSRLIEEIVIIGQDQQCLGAIIVPNKEEVLLAAKSSSLIDSNASEVSKEITTSLLRQELAIWTSEFSHQIGPLLVIDNPFKNDNGSMTGTMKLRRISITAEYKDQIAQLYG